MPGIGTIVNTAAIVVGGLVGLACGRRLTERYQKTIVSGMAVSVMFVGVAGTFQEMLRAGADGRLVSRGGLMLVISLALGSVLGEWWNLEGLLERFAAWVHTDKHIRVANMLPSLIIAVVWAFAEKALGA